ncbi:TPA: glutathione binding-like protein [Streptococcus pyogenes]
MFLGQCSTLIATLFLKTIKPLEKVKQASYKRMDIAMTHLDGLIGDSGHVYRDQQTIADAYAYAMALWSQKTPKSYENYPHLAAFMAKMLEM